MKSHVECDASQRWPHNMKALEFSLKVKKKKENVKDSLGRSSRKNLLTLLLAWGMA